MNNILWIALNALISSTEASKRLLCPFAKTPASASCSRMATSWSMFQAKRDRNGLWCGGRSGMVRLTRRKPNCFGLWEGFEGKVGAGGLILGCNVCQSTAGNLELRGSRVGLELGGIEPTDVPLSQSPPRKMGNIWMKNYAYRLWDKGVVLTSSSYHGSRLLRWSV